MSRTNVDDCCNRHFHGRRWLPLWLGGTYDARSRTNTGCHLSLVHTQGQENTGSVDFVAKKTKCLSASTTTDGDRCPSATTDQDTDLSSCSGLTQEEEKNVAGSYIAVRCFLSAEDSSVRIVYSFVHWKDDQLPPQNWLVPVVCKYQTGCSYIAEFPSV